MSVSVENFYWVLYENLLKPSKIDCRYQWPFGSGQVTKRAYEGEPIIARPKYEKHDIPKSPHHAFLHFDQEPIYQENRFDIQAGTEGSYLKNLRILANSEISDIKKQFCRDFQLLDWYYFYHGFAALDWYRDAEYVDQDRGITDAFSSFNHIIRNKRSYRMSLTARLAAEDLLKFGTVSFHGSFKDCEDEIQDPNTELSGKSVSLIEKHLIQQRVGPLIVDQHDVDGNFSAKFGGNMFRMRQRSFLHLVNETIFYDRKQHLTEKTFHPIVHQRPFILVAAPKHLAYLRSYGFKTFSGWIDESYDDIEDDDLRMDHITQEVKRIASQPIDQLRRLLQEMKPVLDFNKKHFFGEFKKIIADELVDNFETCLRIWNNSRIDDRSVKQLDREHYDRVKQMLSK